MPIGIYQDGVPHGVLTDHLNSPRDVFEIATQNTVWRWNMVDDAFGERPGNFEEDPDVDGISFKLDMRFPGQFYDSESGLHYNYFRDYEAGTGRYMQSDPIGLNGSINTFSYVDSSPIMSIDKLGLVKWKGYLSIQRAGAKVKIRRFSIPFEVASFVLDVEACKDGKKTKVKINGTLDETSGISYTQVAILSKVELEDGFFDVNPNSLIGRFSASGSGFAKTKGTVSAGRGSGTFTGGGLVAGSFKFSGMGQHAAAPDGVPVSPREIECECEE
ncbi:MAG: RHS repeat domain-containing protein [Arenimonas sp.]